MVAEERISPTDADGKFPKLEERYSKEAVRMHSECLF